MEPINKSLLDSYGMTIMSEKFSFSSLNRASDRLIFNDWTAISSLFPQACRFIMSNAKMIFQKKLFIICHFYYSKDEEHLQISSLLASTLIWLYNYSQYCFAKVVFNLQEPNIL